MKQEAPFFNQTGRWIRRGYSLITGKTTHYKGEMFMTLIIFLLIGGLLSYGIWRMKEITPYGNENIDD
ncbi:hypothetical protein [Bacillus sp. FJAT-53711]